MVRAKKKGKINIFIKLLFAAFLCYIAIMFIQLRIQINEKKEQLESVQQKVAQQQLQYDELNSLLHAEIDDAYIEKIARSLGYGRPGERVYENITGK